jgi:hypothetical protein
MSEKGQGQNGGGQGAGAGAGGQGATPGTGGTAPPRSDEGGGQAPQGRAGGGQQASQRKPPNPNPPSGTIEFPDGGRLTGEEGKFTYTDPNGRTGEWKDGGWVDPSSGSAMPDDFRGRAPDPNRVREGRDW